MVELVLAIALAVLVAAILAALIRGLLASGEKQTLRLQGPVAARTALRTMSREIACAFAPPAKNLPPLKLAAATEPGKPEVDLSFFVPVRIEATLPLPYDVEQVSYQVQAARDGGRDLLRISAPCSGPATNAPVTNRLLHGQFALAIEAVTNGATRTEWPPPYAKEPGLPDAMRLTLSRPGESPLRTEVLIQTAVGIRSPLERRQATDAEK